MTKRHKSQPAQTVTSPNRSSVAFSMPEAIDPTAWMTDYTGVFYNPYGEYYQPPIERKGLAKVARANAHHGAILMARRNMVAGRFTNQRATITAFVHNYLQFGDAGLLKARWWDCTRSPASTCAGARMTVLSTCSRASQT